MQEMAVAVRADGAIGEDRVVERSHLLEIAARSGGDQARRAESLIHRAHHLAERGRYRRIVEVLKYHDRRPGQRGELLDLPIHAAVGVAFAWRGIAAESGRAREADCRR